VHGIYRFFLKLCTYVISLVIYIFLDLINARNLLVLFKIMYVCIKEFW